MLLDEKITAFDLFRLFSENEDERKRVIAIWVDQGQNEQDISTAFDIMSCIIGVHHLLFGRMDNANSALHPKN